jgi:hypothetical protein
LIYEYFSGGGLAEQSTFPAVVGEGYAMLNALSKDFSRNSNWEVMTILDKRIAENVTDTSAKKTIMVSSKSETETAFNSTLREVDAALIVAPETDGTLFRLTSILENTGSTTLLGSSSRAIESSSSKEKATRLAKSLGVPVPETVSISAGEEEEAIFSAARTIGFPVVIKPHNGAGCEGVYVLNNRQDLDRALKSLGGDRRRTELVLQEFVRGIDASVSMIISKSRHAMPLCMNRQLIKLKTPEEPSSYEGGYTSFDHSTKNEALEYSRRMAESLEGLRGYVGMDFVLTEKKPVFIELNARITTSYAGLYRVLRIDGKKGVSNAIVRAALNDELPSHVEVSGYVYYSKLLLKPDIRVNKDMIDVLSNLEYVESPPLLEEVERQEAFLASEGKSLEEASEAKLRNEKKFDSIARRLMEESTEKTNEELEG